jgi:hypothetical protein
MVRTDIKPTNIIAHDDDDFSILMRNL